MSSEESYNLGNVNATSSKGREVRRRRHGRWAAISFLLATYQLTCASMSAYVDAEFQFDFGLHAATLEAEPRTRLAAAVNVARSWCGFEVAIVTGHADSSEDASSRSLIDLSVARAAYVGKLLEELGMPRKRIYEEGKGAGQPHLPWSGRVEVYLKGEGTGGRGCNIPPDTRGFRVRD